MHFGSNTVILGAPARLRQMGNRGHPDPNRPRRHPCECICEIWTHMRVSEPSWCHGNYNYPFAGAHQSDHVFTKMHQSAQNAPKWPKMAKRGKIRLHALFRPPPPSPNHLKYPQCARFLRTRGRTGGILEVLARVGGLNSSCRRILPLAIVGYFIVFRALWCILVKTWSFW